MKGLFASSKQGALPLLGVEKLGTGFTVLQEAIACCCSLKELLLLFFLNQLLKISNYSAVMSTVYKYYIK